MGKKNQIYAKYVRIMQSADDPNEIYLVLKKDQPMDKKYIKQFDNMFTEKDVILTIAILIRGKNKEQIENSELEESTKQRSKKSGKGNDSLEEDRDSPFWTVQ